MSKVKDGKRYVASRFNVKAGSGDDLVLYNSLTGAMGRVLPKNRELVENALSNGIEGEPNGVLKELCDRGFFIPAGADELQKARELYMADRYRNDTLHLIILPTEDCNFRCVYCYELFKHKKMPPAIRKGVKLFVKRRAPELKSMAL